MKPTARTDKILVQEVAGELVVYDLKRQLLMLAAAAAPMQEMCGELMRRHVDIIPKESRVYYRDVQDHAKRVTQSIDSMREMVTAAMQVNLALVAVGQNEVVKKLAGWGAIIWALVALSGIPGIRYNEVALVFVPFDAALPVRANPRIALAASRFRLRASVGASVATTIMQDPSAWSAALPAC